MAKDPIGAFVRNLVLLQRIGSSLSAESRGFIEDLYGEIVAAIAKHDPTGVQARYQQGRFDRLMEDIAGLSDEAFAEVYRHVRQRLAELGAAQASWAGQTLAEAIGAAVIRENGLNVVMGGRALGVNRMKAILDSEPFEGAILREWAERQERKTVFDVRRQIRLGMAQQETLDDIIRRVRGKSNGRGGFIGGVMQSTKHGTEAIVRTGVNFISNAGHMAAYEANTDVLMGVEYTATLDSRTTLICASLDGERWPMGSDQIRTPPTHYGCRSVLTPIVDWGGLGIEPPDTGTRASRTYAVRDGKLVQTGGEQVKASKDYADWFRSQPNAVQDEIIGPGRARLFREGKVSFKDMVTGDGQLVPLDKLEAA